MRLAQSSGVHAGSAAADERHLRRHDGHEQDVRVERQIGHLQNGIGDVIHIHARLNGDLQRLTTLVKLGQALLSSNKKSDAEGYFLQALSYPWYTVTGYPEIQQQLREQYIMAGRGLISSRRGDLAALQQIVFVPSAMEELAAVLERAIQEAKTQR